jgi:magnesium chelatase family protein
MTSRVSSYVLVGVDAVPVTIECDILRRLPAVAIVGLPATAVRECADRVRSAIVSAGYEFPRARVVVSVSPSDLRKTGAGLDLPIAVAILVASGQLPPVRDDARIVGELTLTGDVRPIRGSVAMATAHNRAGGACTAGLYLPPQNARTAYAVDSRARVVRTLRDIGAALDPERSEWPDLFSSTPVAPSGLDFRDVTGNTAAIDPLVDAARTRRPVVLRGSPGCGKTMIAARCTGLLGPLSYVERVTVARIMDAVGLGSPGMDPGAMVRPFRAPHHTVSTAGLIGGANLTPGEACLAHTGVLFLDEFPEFPRHSREALRAPIEDGLINIARYPGRVVYPSRAWLIVAVNPCPCGWFGHPTRVCTCSAESIASYAARWQSDPLLRDAVVIDLAPVSPADLLAGADRWPDTAALAARVA